MSVEELKKAVAELPPEKLARFRAWFTAFDEELWDRQIEEDAKNGKLDKLFQGSMDDFEDGRIKKL